MAFDSDAAAVMSHAANVSSGCAQRSDLSVVDLELLAEQAGALGVRGVIGGPPCQGFSNGNVTKRKRDPRNKLVFAFADIVARLNQEDDLDFFLMENVTGLLAQKQAHRYSRLKGRLRAAGFEVSAHRLDAADFGVPQVRKRVLLLGLNSSRFAGTKIDIRRSRKAAPTVREAIGGLPEPVFFAPSKGPRDIPYHPNHWTMQPRSKRFVDGRFNRWRSFRKLEWDEPSPTVAYGNREIHVHPDGTRRLSILEAMILQGLPRKCVLRGNFSQQVTQVSNLVPPPLARAVARALRRAINVEA